MDEAGDAGALIGGLLLGVGRFAGEIEDLAARVRQRLAAGTASVS